MAQHCSKVQQFSISVLNNCDTDLFQIICRENLVCKLHFKDFRQHHHQKNGSNLSFNCRFRFEWVDIRKLQQLISLSITTCETSNRSYGSILPDLEVLRLLFFLKKIELILSYCIFKRFVNGSDMPLFKFSFNNF